MKKTGLLLFFVFILTCDHAPIKAQQAIQDSLQTAFLNAKADTIASHLLHELMYFYIYDNTREGTEKISELNALVNKKGDPDLQYLLLYFRVVLTHTPDSIIEARKCLNEFMELSRSHNDKLNYFRGLMELVNQERNSENYQEMLRLLLLSLDYARDTLKDPKMTGFVYGSLAVYYSDQLDTVQAIEYSKKCLDAVTLTNDIENMSGASNRVAMFYMDQGQYDTAKAYFLYSYYLCLKSNAALIWPESLINLSDVYRLTHDYDSALFYGLWAVRLAKKLNRDYALSGAYWSTAQSYRAIGKPDSALVYYELATERVENGNYDSDVLFYPDLAGFYSSTGNYKQAYVYLQKAMAQKDKLYNSDNNKVLKEMDAKYQASRKEQEILKQEELIKRQRILNYSILAVAAFFLLLVFYIFRSYRLKQKSNKLLAIAKEKAEQSEKFKQQFLANMSHEIRTPINAVLGMTNLLIDKDPRSDQFKYLDGINNSSATLLHIINDILDISKIEAGKIELEQIDFSIHEVLGHVKQTLIHKSSESGIQLITDIDEKIPDVVIGDPVRLNQVLLNLAGNAIKFTEKGSVTIEVNQSETGIKFSIIDTGVGIPQEKLQSVFESFTQAHSSDTRRFGGTGLGLTISRQLVELMGGKISVESEVGSGSTFSFVINYPVGSAERMKQQKLSDQVDGSILNGLSILLADDNEYNRMVVRDTLQSKARLEITEAIDGKNAIDILTKKDFDVILMDVQMPLMDGFETTRNIRTNFIAPKNQIPVIALTASVIRNDIDKCKQAGMNDYVSKPFKASQLIIAIAKATGREISYIDRNHIELKNKAKIANGIIDLNYLKEFCEGDVVRINKYINIFLDSAPVLKKKLNKSIKENNLEAIVNQIHGFKTKWIMMGMDEAKDLAVSIENLCRKEAPDHSLIKTNTLKLMAFVEDAAKELKQGNNNV